jgi:formylglycine-generating enzyme required for sulfatase activity
VSTKATFSLIAIIALGAGCGKKGPADVVVEDLKVLQPKSGGEMLLIPAGEFTMGDGDGRPDETPHTVYVHSFYMDRVPVTQELYASVMGSNPSKRKGKDQPVERTQWTDAVRFCNRCSELEGLTPCYDLNTWRCNFEADGYRLPTEAEWEYACRARSSAKYCFGDDEGQLPEYAWFKPHSGGMTRPVGQKLPNRWGLHDMHGNVWQWCNDYYGAGYYAESPREDPRGPATGKMRVLRGGAWDCLADKCRSAYRHKEYPVYSDACFGADSYGFRRARKADAGGKEQLVARPARPAPRPDKKAASPAPAVGPAPGDGKIDPARLRGTIVFVSDRSGTLKIWRMDANGKHPKQLTHGANPDADPRFSPDGKRIMYTSLRGGFPEVWLMDRDGAGAKFITKGSQANWSPNGRSIVFIRDNQTYVREPASGRERRVTPAAWERCGVPAWSPDGRRLAVASRHLGTIGIFILGLDGKEQAQLKAQEPCCTPQWSRDGKRILCQTVQGHIHQTDTDGENWEQLTFGADVQHDARYSPDGSMIVFCRAPSPEGPWQICVKDLDGDDLDFVQLTKEGSNLLPDWHPAE